MVLVSANSLFHGVISRFQSSDISVNGGDGGGAGLGWGMGLGGLKGGMDVESEAGLRMCFFLWRGSGLI